MKKRHAPDSSFERFSIDDLISCAKSGFASACVSTVNATSAISGFDAPNCSETSSSIDLTSSNGVVA
jgi:hypothetical protein